MIDPVSNQLRFSQAAWPGMAAWLKSQAVPAGKGRAAALTFALTAAVFAVDVQVPLGVADAIPYVWVMLSASWAPRPSAAVALALLCSGLTWLGFLWSPPGAPMWMVVANRLLTLFAIWLTTFLVVKRKANQLGLDVARAQLTQNARLLHSILSSLKEGVIVADRKGEVVLANPAAAALIGRVGERGAMSPTGDILQGLAAAIPVSIAVALRRARGGWRVDAQETALTAGVETLHFNLNGAPMFSPEGELTGGIVTIQDITQRKALEQAIVDAAENEQRRIGLDIHDGLVQQLSGLSLIVQTMRARSEPDSARLFADLEKLAGYLDEASSAARRLAHGLFPPELDRFGLPAALEHLAEETEALHGIRVEWAPELEALRGGAIVARESSIHLFRIAQEALGNACRHSGASHVRLALGMSDGIVELAIDDDGRGLADGDGPRRGIGLRSMAYRARLLRGELKLLPSRCGGLRVQCRLASAAVPPAEAVAS